MEIKQITFNGDFMSFSFWKGTNGLRPEGSYLAGALVLVSTTGMYLSRYALARQARGGGYG